MPDRLQGIVLNHTTSNLLFLQNSQSMQKNGTYFINNQLSFKVVTSYDIREIDFIVEPLWYVLQTLTVIVYLKNRCQDAYLTLDVIYFEFQRET